MCSCSIIGIDCVKPKAVKRVKIVIFVALNAARLLVGASGPIIVLYFLAYIFETSQMFGSWYYLDLMLRYTLVYCLNKYVSYVGHGLAFKCVN